MKEKVKIEAVLRKANQEDAKFLFILRNDPEAFRWFSKPQPVKWEDHLNWIKDVLQGKIKKYLYIIESEGKKAGQFRLDEIEKKESENKDLKRAITNISLFKDFRGKGLGTLGLRQGIGLAKRLGFQELIAEIHQDNLASLGLFKKMGFALKKTKAPWQTYFLKI